jgi:hypothetical protein
MPRPWPAAVSPLLLLHLACVYDWSAAAGERSGSEATSNLPDSRARDAPYTPGSEAKARVEARVQDVAPFGHEARKDLPAPLDKSPPSDHPVEMDQPAIPDTLAKDTRPPDTRKPDTRPPDSKKADLKVPDLGNKQDPVACTPVGSTCSNGLSCYRNSYGGSGLGACSQTCSTSANCTLQPATGTATASCGAEGYCVLSCESGETCPTGMTCDAFKIGSGQTIHRCQF